MLPPDAGTRSGRLHRATYTTKVECRTRLNPTCSTLHLSQTMSSRSASTSHFGTLGLHLQPLAAQPHTSVIPRGLIYAQPI